MKMIFDKFYDENRKLQQDTLEDVLKRKSYNNDQVSRCQIKDILNKKQ